MKWTQQGKNKTDQLAIYKSNRGVELGTNKNNTGLWSKQAINPHSLPSLSNPRHCFFFKRMVNSPGLGQISGSTTPGWEQKRRQTPHPLAMTLLKFSWIVNEMELFHLINMWYTGDEIDKRPTSCLRSPPHARPRSQGYQTFWGCPRGRKMSGPRAIIKSQIGIKTRANSRLFPPGMWMGTAWLDWCISSRVDLFVWLRNVDVHGWQLKSWHRWRS